jgi:SNF2 family DNA or RNA helicase
MGRLLIPGIMNVDRFEVEHVSGKDLWGNFSKFKNIGEEDHVDPSVVTLKDKLAPVIQIKRKTDPDVRDFFPRQVEEYRYVNQHPQEKHFYEAVEEALDGYIQRTEQGGDLSAYMVLRQIAGHPSAILHSQGEMAKMVVEEVGEAGIRAIPCAKLGNTLSYLEPLVKGQGAQAVLFTFFGQSVLPILEQALMAEGYRVVVNHGGMTQPQRERSRQAFGNREADIFLTSDAGSRGINLKTAEYVVNYELPLTHANYIQRINRTHRIDSEHPSVTCQSFITYETVEEGIVTLNQNRNEWSDYLFGDDDTGAERLTAADRKMLRRIARDSAKNRSNPGRPWPEAA